MTFGIISEEEFIKFRDQSRYRTFMQTIEIAKLRQKNGWKVYYVGLKENEQLLGASILFAKKRYFGKYEFYALRGPLIDFENLEIVQIFLKEMKKFVKKENGYCLRMDPYVVYKQRNSNGDIIEGGVDNSSLVDLLKQEGFLPVEKHRQEQVSWMYALDIEGKSEEEILRNMKPNTRNTIRKTLKHGIEIEELKFEQLDIFYQIMKETGKRKSFAIRNLDYFQTMYQLFKPKEEIKFLISKLNLDKHIHLLDEEKYNLTSELEKLSSAKYNAGKRKSLEDGINGLNKRINLANELKEKHGKEIILSGSMFIMNQPEIIYLSSGNYEEFMMYHSQYLIQWEMIKYGIAHQFQRYNFYGIPNTFDKNDKDYGIYEFKTGFNGYVEQLIGEYVVSLSPIYAFIKLVHRIRKK